MYNSTEKFWPTVENLDAVANGERVILTNRVFVLSKSKNQVYPLPFNVFTNQLEIFSERGFPLLNRFSQLIAWMRDSGIIEKLYNDFYYNATMLHYIRNRDSDMFNEGIIVLTLNHMDGAFTLLIFGYFIGLVAFGVEIIMGIYTKRRRADFARRNWKLLRYAWRQVAIMRSMQKNGKKNATKKNGVKWDISKNVNKKNRNNTKIKRLQKE